MTAKDIISDVMKRHLIGPEDFFGPLRDMHLVSARSEVAHRLKAAKFSVRKIALLMKRNDTTICNYLYPKLRAQKKARHAAKRGKTVKIRAEYLPKLTQLAALTDASIEAAVNQAVSDMLDCA